METRLNTNAPQRDTNKQSLPQPMMCSRPSQININAHRDEQPKNIDQDNPINDALIAICEHEIDNLKPQWPLIGQLKQPPKRLSENLLAYCINKDRRAWLNYDNATNCIRPLFRDIRTAIETLQELKRNKGPVSKTTLHLSYKARVFLKRLAHDIDIKQSCHGARRFREHLKRAKEEMELYKLRCKPSHYDLDEGWEVEKVTTQKQLMNAGKVLGVCVAKIDSVSEKYFYRLVNETHGYWILRYEQKTKCLFETIQAKPDDPDFDPNEPLDIGEEEGFDDALENMPDNSVAQLVWWLGLNPSQSEAFIRAGMFRAFLDGNKDEDKPDIRVNVNGNGYALWFHDDEIILAKFPRHADMAQSGLDGPRKRISFIDKEWQLFKKTETVWCIETRRMVEDGACVDPAPDPVVRWCSRGAGDISEDELLNVLVHHAAMSVNS